MPERRRDLRGQGALFLAIFLVLDLALVW